MLRHVDWYIVTDVSKYRTALIFRDKQSKNWKATVYQSTRRKNPEDSNAAVRTSVSQEDVPAVKEKGREDNNRKRKIFRCPEGRLELVLVVLLLMRTTMMIRLNLNKFVTPLGAHSSETQSTNLLPRFILLLLEVCAEFALVLCTELI
jgi:hypothetical protein